MPAIRRTLAATSLAAVCSAALTIGAVGIASATPSPNGPGQPGTGGTTPPGGVQTSCANYQSTPGNSAGSNGSPFNPNGQAGTVYAGNPGTASATHSNSPHSVSEYDIACFQQTTHGH
jgi:hypothetical protein